MNPGKLNKRIVLQRKGSIADDEGISTPNWVDVAPIWAAKEPLSTKSREFVEAAAVNAEQTVRFRIRYRTDVTPDMRVLERGAAPDKDRVYEITLVNEDALSNRTETHLMTKELRNG